LVENTLKYILTHSNKADMISYMKSHPEVFDEAIKLAIENDQPYSWRAAWLLWSCMDKNDQRIHIYIEEIINTLPTISDNQLRELLIILQKMDLNEVYEGKLFDICVNIWNKIDKQPSVRYNAFKLIIKTIKKHSDLSKELIFITESHYMDPLSDTAKKSITKMMATCEKKGNISIYENQMHHKCTNKTHSCIRGKKNLSFPSLVNNPGDILLQ